MSLSVVTVCSMFWIVVKRGGIYPRRAKKTVTAVWLGLGLARGDGFCCVGGMLVVVVVLALALVLMLGIKARLWPGGWSC